MLTPEQIQSLQQEYSSGNQSADTSAGGSWADKIDSLNTSESPRPPANAFNSIGVSHFGPFAMGALTPSDTANAERYKPNVAASSDDNLATSLLKGTGNLSSSTINAAKGFLGGVGSLLHNLTNYQQFGSDIKNVAQNRSQVPGALKDIGSRLPEAVVKTTIPPFIQEGATGAAALAIGEPKVAADSFQEGTNAMVNDPFQVAITALVGKQLLEGTKTGNAIENKILGGAEKVNEKIGQAYDTITGQTEPQLEAKILSNFEKGIKPNIPGKKSLGQYKKYQEQAVQGIKIIRDNKSDLSFEGPDGETITGTNPQTPQQLASALEQTKKSIFQRYDSLAKQSGEAGLKIDASPIANELNTVIGNKALQLTHPQTIAYAQALKDRLEGIGSFDATTAQDIIQNYNNSLQAFYRNPTYETASQAAVDAMVVNKMRVALDDGITGLTGTQYQDLKNQYGSLKAIEQDVVKAALRDARKNVKGLIDYSDIFSGSQLVNGLLNLNPATMAQGIAAKGIAAFYKYLNSPNKAIQTMFNAAEKLPPTTPVIPNETSISPEPMTPEGMTKAASGIGGGETPEPGVIPAEQTFAKNVGLQLQAQGFQDLADKVSDIKPTDFKSFADLKSYVKGLTSDLPKKSPAVTTLNNWLASAKMVYDYKTGK